MRLTPDEIAAIKECAARHFGEGAIVRLFGSRVDDRLYGGDIDLHVIADSPDRCTLAAECDFYEHLRPDRRATRGHHCAAARLQPAAH